jgi:hypothetical protein
VEAREVTLTGPLRQGGRRQASPHFAGKILGRTAVTGGSRTAWQPPKYHCRNKKALDEHPRITLFCVHRLRKKQWASYHKLGLPDRGMAAPDRMARRLTHTRNIARH